MNLDLVTTFRSVATDLLIQFGRPVTHTHGTGSGVEIQAVLEQSAEPAGEYGERVESRWTATVAKASSAVVGDTLTHPADDPADDDVVWKLTQMISDDGFVQQFALRLNPPVVTP